MRLIAATTTAALTAGLLITTGTAATADSVHALGLSSYRDIVVDQAHSRVFVSGGALVAANLDGAVTSAVAGVSSARQMALTANGSQLVVANGDGLTVVNPATATVVRTIPTGPDSCPDAVAPASGLMFFTYGDCDGGTPGLGAVDLATDTITTGLTTGAGFWDGAQLVSVPSSPTMLAARFGSRLSILDTTGGATPTTTVRATSLAASSNFRDLALTPDGSKVITASGGTYRHQVFSTADLSHVGDYQTDSYPDAVAIRADGLVAAGIDGSYEPDVWFFPQDASATTKKVDFGPGGNPGESVYLEPAGLAFGTKKAYAVTGDVYGEALTLRTITTGPAASVSVTTDAATYGYGRTATITARLLSHTTQSRAISVYATGVGGAKRLLKTANVDSTGKLVVKVALSRNTTFQAVFAGDDDFSAGSASRAVKVAGSTTMSTTSKARSGSYHLFKAGTKPQVNGRVASSNPNACVRVVGQRVVGKTWRTFDSISCLRLSASSTFAVRLLGSYPAGTKVRVLATFVGGAGNAASATSQYYLMWRR